MYIKDENKIERGRDYRAVCLSRSYVYRLSDYKYGEGNTVAYILRIRYVCFMYFTGSVYM